MPGVTLCGSKSFNKVSDVEWICNKCGANHNFFQSDNPRVCDFYICNKCRERRYPSGPCRCDRD